VAAVEAAVNLAAEPKQLVWIADADHFFAPSRSLNATAPHKGAGSKLEEVKNAIRTWAQRSFPSLHGQ
jgi:hypothetical protein